MKLEERDPELASRLRSEDEESRIAALEEVASRKDPVYLPYIVAAVYHVTPEIRRKAAVALRGLRDPRVAEVALLALVTEGDPEVVFNLIMVFLYRPREEAVDLLVGFLNYPDFRVRSAAVDVLGALAGVFGRFDIIERLLTMLEDPRTSVVMVTLRSLVHACESLADRDLLEAVYEGTGKLTQSPNQMISDLAMAVQQQVAGALSLMGGE